jgi:hypothetical protein
MSNWFKQLFSKKKKTTKGLYDFNIPGGIQRFGHNLSAWIINTPHNLEMFELYATDNGFTVEVVQRPIGGRVQVILHGMPSDQSIFNVGYIACKINGDSFSIDGGEIPANQFKDKEDNDNKLKPVN